VTSTPSGSDSQSLPQIQLGKKFWLYALIGVAVVVLLQIHSLGDWWNLIFFEPMLNSLLFLYRLLGRSFVLSIIVFTLLIKLITLPFTLKQLQTTKKTQEIQGKVEELKKKYGNDKEKLNQETIKLYQEAGISPTGCLGPMLIQFPIWIGMYQSILNILATNPLQLFALGKHIYPIFPQLSQLVPFQSRFLWVDLGKPDPYYILPILVVASMWIQQKMSTTSSGDSQQQQMNQSMQLMMPLMFGLFMYTAPAGVAFYFVVSNITGIVQQYYSTGWGDLFRSGQKAKGALPAKEQRAITSSDSASADAVDAKGKADGSKKRKKKH
jgi:YidC/Oxa1 family membrane protein insertase